MSLPANFWSKTRRSDCILWTGALNGRGYPCFGVAGKSQLAHRVAYEDVHGEIPEGLTVDHLCRVPRCVNVDHMELVSIAENNRRGREARGYRIGGECANGHELTEANTRSGRGRLICLECQHAYGMAYRDAAPSTARLIRDWARAQGLPIKPRGVIATSIRAAYFAAHPSPPT